MAIKVIRRGKRKEVAQVTCRMCHSILEYTRDDVKASQQYNDEDYWISCPICGTAITVDPGHDFPWLEPSPEIYDT